MSPALAVCVCERARARVWCVYERESGRAGERKRARARESSRSRSPPAAVMLADTRSPAVLAVAPNAVILADTRAPAVFAPADAPNADMLADTRAPAVLANAPQAKVPLAPSAAPLRRAHPLPLPLPRWFPCLLSWHQLPIGRLLLECCDADSLLLAALSPLLPVPAPFRRYRSPSHPRRRQRRASRQVHTLPHTAPHDGACNVQQPVATREPRPPRVC